MRMEELAAAKQKGWQNLPPFSYDHGYLFSAYRRGRRHFHALLNGRSRSGRTLLECATRYWSHIDFPENLPPVTPESVKATIEKASRVLENALAVYRGNGWPIKEEYVNTLAACESVLRR
jgi:hypothetical protein